MLQAQGQGSSVLSGWEAVRRMSVQIGGAADLTRRRDAEWGRAYFALGALSRSLDLL